MTLQGLRTECPLFECPPELRPAQRRVDDFQMYGYNVCPIDDEIVNIVKKVVKDADDGEIEKYRELMHHCCFERDVCYRACQMPQQACHKRYHYCMEKVCLYKQVDYVNQPHKECIQIGMFNSASSYSTFGDESDCGNYTQAQREGCECVPAVNQDAAIMQSMISFYKVHNPSKLNAEGTRLQDVKVWKQWRPERPRMFLESFWKYRHQAVEIKDRSSGNYVSQGKKSRRIVFDGKEAFRKVTTTTPSPVNYNMPKPPIHAEF